MSSVNTVYPCTHLYGVLVCTIETNNPANNSPWPQKTTD